MNCKNCANKKYDDAHCDWYRGWFCLAWLWDERGDEGHGEPDNDDVWEGCKLYKPRDGREEG